MDEIFVHKRQTPSLSPSSSYVSAAVLPVLRHKPESLSLLQLYFFPLTSLSIISEKNIHQLKTSNIKNLMNVT